MPDDDNPYIFSEQTALQGVMVKNLMQVDVREWDLDLIEDMFNTRDKELILSIPLGDSAAEDSWYWVREPAGAYTVKSAYKYIQVESVEVRGFLDWSRMTLMKDCIQF